MQFKRFIPAVLLTALMTAAVGFCVPQFANKLAWIGGAHGVAPLIIFLRIASMFSAIVCLLCIALTFSFRLGRKQSVRLCKILCLLEVGWTLFSIQQTVSSGALFQNYCRGLSQTIHSRVTNADLNAVFSAALLAAKDNGGIFYNPNPGPPFNNIFPHHRPAITTYTAVGQSQMSAALEWNCAGGGFGIVSADSVPSKRVWLDEAVPFADGMWVVTRGE